MTTALENLLSERFIARPEVKAIQHSSGDWSPHREFNPESGRHDGAEIPWRRADLRSHLAGQQTFGHYVVSKNSTCKLFTFDIDLEEDGLLPEGPIESEEVLVNSKLRVAWMDRSHPARWYMKLQFKQLAHRLMSSLMDKEDGLLLPCAAAYSGGKGIHVYCFFPDPIPAAEARFGAKTILDHAGAKIHKGKHTYKHPEFTNMTIEVYPKQDSMEEKEYGNLVRLPLGRNNKNPKDPTFFIDMTAPLGSMTPLDPIIALTKANPWE